MLVGGSDGLDELLGLDRSQPRELGDHAQDGRRLVAAGRVGAEVRRVGLDQERPRLEALRGRPRAGRRAEGDGQREADREAGAGQASGHLGVTAEGVQDATTAPGEERLGNVVVRLAVVDEHRQVVRGGERELARERLALDVRRRQVPEVVQPDLPPPPAPGVGGERLEAGPGRLVHLGGMVRMDAHGGVDDPRMPARELERGLRRGEVPAGHADALDPRFDGASDHGVAIGVEARVLEVGVRVDQAGQPLRERADGSGRDLQLDPREDRARGAGPPVRGPAPPTEQRVEPRAARPALVVRDGDAELLVDARGRPGATGASRWPMIRHASAITASTCARARPRPPP